MERGLVLLVAALVVYVTPSVQGTAHLSFSNDTVDITRTGCGVSKLCVESPEDCDPAGGSGCLFASVTATIPVAPNGTTLSIELRGESSGFIALGLTANVSQGTTLLFICGQNNLTNGSFFFRTRERINPDSASTANERIVTDIRGMVNGSVIKCEFNIPNVNATNIASRSSHATTAVIVLGNGTANGTDVGAFTIIRDSGPLNLADPASNVNGTAANNSGGAVQPHAVLLLLSVLSLLMLRA
ncbi:putative ferric-chelate reductase 1 [Cebidichthys violaceus]|uniref:putative ferric-chelate reductase 1 n=1 Tax=Cebidichthys violaceus TaxID=271503 RepID=UPI0035C9804E